MVGKQEHIDFVTALVSEAPCAQSVLDKHIRDNFDELLFWVFMGDLCIWSIERLLVYRAEFGAEATEEMRCIKKMLVGLDERLALGADNDIENAISVSFAEVVSSAVELAAKRNPGLGVQSVLYEKVKQMLPSALKREVEIYERC